MRVRKILADVRLVIADLEVELNGTLRSSPTLCAILPGEDGAAERVVPLNTPDGRPIFMKTENAIPVSLP
jgi:hypothetical protein